MLAKRETNKNIVYYSPPAVSRAGESKQQMKRKVVYRRLHRRHRRCYRLHRHNHRYRRRCCQCLRISFSFKKMEKKSLVRKW